MSKAKYLLRSLGRFLTHAGYRCPNCNSATRTQVAEKYLITQLNRCRDCRLLFRTPTDDPHRMDDYYENEYSQKFAAEIPLESEIPELKRRNFSGTQGDYSYYVGVLKAAGIPEGARLLDFGCSWGYGSFQLANAGFDVTGFEIAATRREFARRAMNVRLIDDIESTAQDSKYRGSFDVFFSSHVLEHVSHPTQIIKFANALLKRDGIFISFTPNGSEACRRVSGTWMKLWGEVHPNFIDDEFLDHHFQHSPRAFGSSPLRSDVVLDVQPNRLNLDELEREELFFIARKVGESW